MNKKIEDTRCDGVERSHLVHYRIHSQAILNVIMSLSLLHNNINSVCVRVPRSHPDGMARDVVVGIATRYRLDGLGIESRWG